MWCRGFKNGLITSGKSIEMYFKPMSLQNYAFCVIESFSAYVN